MVKFMLWSAVATSLAAAVIASPVQERQEYGRPSTTTTTTSGSSSSPTSSSAGGSSSPTPIRTPDQDRALKNALVLAVSEQERQAILLPNPPDASNITYQFINNTVRAPTGGTIALSAVSQFPALIGTNVGMAIGFVNACGLNVPHSHPRANEFLTVVQGKLIGGLVVEANPGNAGNLNGTNPVGPLPFVNTTLSNYKGMLFPQGTIHFQFNPTCEPAVFAAAFDNSDPGRTQIARNFFTIQPDSVLISATGGTSDDTLLDASRIDSLRGKIPSAFATLIDTCVKQCNLPKY